MALARIRYTLLHSKCVHVVYCLIAVCLVYLYYNAVGTPNIKISEYQQLKRNGNAIHHSSVTKQSLYNEVKPKEGSFKQVDEQSHGNKILTSDGPVNIMITFTNAVHNRGLQDKLHTSVRSLLNHATVDMVVHIIGDAESQKLAADIFKQYSTANTAKYKVEFLDVEKLAKKFEEVIKPMQQHFSYKTGSYYNHALFFLSIAMHSVLPETTKRVIMFDADIKFLADIRELNALFENFKSTNILGIAHEMQPVYRHTFWQYRKENPGTRVGEPPPNGLTGFNSGILLLDLEKMRHSNLYKSSLSADTLKRLTQKYHFKGHLGDQDFFTLLGMEYEELFFVLPCNWNRQLCIWWKDKGYENVFDSYHICEGPIKIYHGNCNTPIPDTQ